MATRRKRHKLYKMKGCSNKRKRCVGGKKSRRRNNKHNLFVTYTGGGNQMKGGCGCSGSLVGGGQSGGCGLGQCPAHGGSNRKRRRQKGGNILDSAAYYGNIMKSAFTGTQPDPNLNPNPTQGQFNK